MTRDWKRLGHAIKARREELGMATQQALADAAGVKRQTISALESGRDRSRMPQTIGKVEKTLGWEPGTAARILGGGEGSVDNGVTGRLADGLSARVIQELSSGEVYESEIVNLGRGESGSPWKLVAILVQDAPLAKMDLRERREVLEQWSRVQRALHGIADDQTGSSDHS